MSTMRKFTAMDLGQSLIDLVQSFASAEYEDEAVNHIVSMHKESYDGTILITLDNGAQYKMLLAQIRKEEV